MRQQFRSGELRFHGELCSQRENTPDGGRNDQRLLQVDGTSGSRRLDTNLCTRDTQEADLSSLAYHSEVVVKTRPYSARKASRQPVKKARPSRHDEHDASLFEDQYYDPSPAGNHQANPPV
ncbi:hypothetical protein HPB52_024946 [Rhipicephalus sanguineus]|uniref:Uncharacterized protein n=1 Tax=Rhipicephalus sanguineus TaxID=34632 RepID=A0A9D4P951_RHISA|nr:hypothetical protein HPB52_024946 [Rhipicephalus sanguineus]